MLKLIKFLPWKIKILFIVGSFISLISVIFELITPTLISQFIRLLFIENKNSQVDLSFFNGLINFTFNNAINARNYMIYSIIVLTVISMSLTFGCTSLIVYAAERSSRYIRENFIRKLNTLSLKNISDLKPESLITRVSDDIAVFWEFLISATNVLTRAISMIIGGCILAVMNNVKMAIGLILLVPIILTIVSIMAKKASPSIKKAQLAVEEITKQVDENILGSRLIKIYDLYKNREEKFAKINKTWKNFNVNAGSIFVGIAPLFFGIFNLFVVVLYSLVVHDVISNVATYDTIVRFNIFIDYSFYVTFGVILGAVFISAFVKGKISATRVIEVLNTNEDKIYVSDGKKITKNFDLKVENLSFKYYSSNPNYTLHNISFSLPFGKTLGLVGPTGSGKSILANLLVNNYLYNEGSILIGDNEIKEVNTKNLHETIGIVYQDALLNTGTIKENMLFAKNDATDEEINQALRDACAYDFVYKFEENLDHVITQGATNLSGGQKQRLSIARTLLTKPKILILDNSTSALDNITAHQVLQNIKNKYSCSTIIISQKLPLIKNADEIIVLSDGNMLDKGNHEKLMKSCSYYNESYNNQLSQ